MTRLITKSSQPENIEVVVTCPAAANSLPLTYLVGQQSTFQNDKRTLRKPRITQSLQVLERAFQGLLVVWTPKTLHPVTHSLFQCQESALFFFYSFLVKLTFLMKCFLTHNSTSTHSLTLPYPYLLQKFFVILPVKAIFCSTFFLSFYFYTLFHLYKLLIN